jgi:hypothetical protein
MGGDYAQQTKSTTALSRYACASSFPAEHLEDLTSVSTHSGVRNGIAPRSVTLAVLNVTLRHVWIRADSGPPAI